MLATKEAKTRETTTYRPDLDGLRAVAVLSVMLFHLGAGSTPGGFVGVDIFFVLSGFFITSQIVSDVRGDKFSLLNFYERRIRRIVPALMFVLAVCTLFAFCVLLPDELVTYLKTLLAAAFSGSNIYFFTQDAYFGPKSQTQMLLHTWSLGVEEQFYILYPIFIGAALAAGRRKAAALVWGIAFASLLACVLLSISHDRAAFFLLPTRAWQLLFGAVIALGFVPDVPSRWVKESAAILGGVAIGASVIFLNSDFNYPGAYALAPTLGAALLIWSGQGQSTVVARLLRLPPLPFVGLISYSLYLWHWPLIVGAHLWFPAEFSNPERAMIVAATFALSIFSWRYVEQPFRHKRGRFISRAAVFSWNGVSLVAVTAVALAGILSHGWAARFSDEMLQLAKGATDVSPVRAECHFETKDKASLEKSCTLGNVADPSMIVYGDSHGIELSYVLSQLASTHHKSVRQFTTSGCPSALNYGAPSTPRCAERNAAITRLLTSLPPTTIFLAAGWENAYQDDRAAYFKGLAAVLDRLHSAGHRVFLIGTAPVQQGGMPVPQTLARHWLLGQDPAAYRFPINVRALRKEDESATKFAEAHGAKYLPFSQLICNGSGCLGEVGGKPLYFDSGHLSVAGAELYAKKVVAPVLWP